MIRKEFKELYCVDTISQDKGWKKVQEAIADINDDITIDFRGVNVIDPWQCGEFKKLLKNEHVHMEFVNSESIVNRIKMMCIIEGCDENRIKNIVVEIPKEKTAEDKKVEHYGNELIPYFNINEDGVARFELDKKYSQIQSTNTLGYIDYAIREIHNNKKVDKFILCFGRLVVLPNVLQIVANMIVQYESEGFHLLVEIDDPETYKNMALFIHIATTKIYGTEERRIKINNELKAGTPGLLIKYKKSKAKDDFGREGKGEIVSSRIAIFRGIDNTIKTNPTFMVDTFNNDYFYTKEHWMIEHDNEEPTSLHIDSLNIGLSEIGICDSFLGSKYHFILPVQQEENESQMVISGFDELGKNIKSLCTIPERMKLVFDSWGVEYNKESLEESINNTKKELEKHKNSVTTHLDGICDLF